MDLWGSDYTKATSWFLVDQLGLDFGAESNWQ